MYEIGKKEIQAVARVIESGKLFRFLGMGTGDCRKFEEELGKVMGVKHTLLLNSGTSALISGLVAAGVGPGDEVIIPAYTFVASALAVVAVGAVPVIADVDETMTLCPKSLEKTITKYTAAVIPVHMRGHPCDMKKISAVAKKKKIIVLEDACQAVGGSFKGKRLGAIGDLGALSFNVFKNISCGEGGAILTNSKPFFDRARMYHDAGAIFWWDDIKPSDVPPFCAQTMRVSEIQGAIMREQLKRMDGILKKLRQRRFAMQDILKDAKSFKHARSNDNDGDCGVSLTLTFEAAKDALAFVAAYKDICGMFRPIDSARHFYSDWKQIMARRTHHPKMNPWKWAKRDIRYTKNMMPESIAICSRTVEVGVPFDKTVAECKKIAKTLKAF